MSGLKGGSKSMNTLLLVSMRAPEQITKKNQGKTTGLGLGGGKQQTHFGLIGWMDGEGQKSESRKSEGA